jgi:Diacylglycerol kinase catalytic domain
VNQLASALVSLDAPSSTAMAVIPLGTANDFATGLGIPEVRQLGKFSSRKRTLLMSWWLYMRSRGSSVLAGCIRGFEAGRW